MKSVLISIQPKWCELIASGKKTVEVRKTKPKLETPFKVYIYMTKEYNRGINSCFYFYKHGKVIGEFVCDDIYTINKDNCGWFYRKDNEVMGIGYAEEIEELFHCIPDEKLTHYLGDNIGYGWHISNLVIYDKPRELGEFYVSVKDHWETYNPSNYINGKWQKPLTRPFQSWGYVESEVEGK